MTEPQAAAAPAATPEPAPARTCENCGRGLLGEFCYACGQPVKGLVRHFSSIVGDFAGMPTVMKRLALVQFFSWSALFIMWINTTPVVAQYIFDAPPAE